MMNEEEFEYWWKILYKPVYNVTVNPHDSRFKKVEVQITLPPINLEAWTYLMDNYSGYLTINFCYHGNNGTRNKNGGFPIDPRYYDEYRNSKLIFKNKNGMYPNDPRWSILGYAFSDDVTAEKGAKISNLIKIRVAMIDRPITLTCQLDLSYSIRRRLNKWLKLKEKWVKHIEEETLSKPTSYHASKFKYYFTVLLHMGNNGELGNRIELPKYLDPTYIEVDAIKMN